MVTQKVDFEWKSKYLDIVTIEDFVALKTKDQITLINSTFHNFIKYGLNAAARDQQQANFIHEVDEALYTGEKPQISVKSGHGTGKTTILAWVILYIGLTRFDVKIPATAPVASQLENMLLPEVSKWNKKLFPKLQGQVSVMADGVKFKNANRCFARTARKENTEALAGVHATFVLYIIDEASGVDQKIFEVIDGALTGDYLQVLTSNPTRTVGTFYDSQNKNKNLYRIVHMDSEKSNNVKKTWLKLMAEKYGITSDEYRVRVKGQFPTVNTDALFTIDEVTEAMNRDQNEVDRSGAFTYAADAARYGDDDSVLSKKRGYDIYWLKGYSKLNTMEYANKIDFEAKGESREPDAIFVDTIGVGAGVLDRLEEKGKKTIEANVSMQADENNVYLNKRAEMYFGLREFVRKGGRIPKDSELEEELLVIRYTYTKNTNKIQLMSKKDIKEELGRSPDKSDSIALHFFSSVRVSSNSSFLHQHTSGNTWASA